ncbi:MAG: hypothetical protein Q7T11_03070 [Deltaproteobacteria bacterium]|nr:hypothetical protein [Deltaproteobacteria bacterium]
MRFLFLLFLLFFNACFGHVDKRGSVTGFRGNTVLTEGGNFQVGALSPDWVPKKLDFRALVFTHRSLASSIAVDAFCKGAFDDTRLALLTDQLFYSITSQKRRLQKTIVLDGREAQRTVVEGKLDGASIVVDAVVLKMNECVFDFTLSSVPDDYREAVEDFEKFYRGFRYGTGP